MSNIEQSQSFITVIFEKILQAFCIFFVQAWGLLLSSIFVFVILFHSGEKITMLSYKMLVPGILALISFVFTVRIFIVFKLKEHFDNPEVKKDFELRKEQGIIDIEYFDELKKLDGYFQVVLGWFAFSIMILIASTIAESFFTSEFPQIKHWRQILISTLGIINIFCATSIIVIPGRIINNIINDLKV